MIWATRHRIAAIKKQNVEDISPWGTNTRQPDTNNRLQGNLYQRELTRGQHTTFHNNPMHINLVG